MKQLPPFQEDSASVHTHEAARKSQASAKTGNTPPASLLPKPQDIALHIQNLPTMPISPVQTEHGSGVPTRPDPSVQANATMYVSDIPTMPIPPVQANATMYVSDIPTMPIPPVKKQEATPKPAATDPEVKIPRVERPDGEGSVSAFIADLELNTPFLVEVSRDPQAASKRYRLIKPITSIGGHKTNDIVLNDEQDISDFQAQLVREGEQIFFVYLRLSSTYILNGTRLRGRSHASARPFRQPLKPGDCLRIGSFSITLVYDDGKQQAQQDESTSIRVDALHLKKEGKHQVVLLNDISLVIPPCAFVALVGGSGTGKSTLMNALSGLHPVQEGQVLYNGQDYYRHQAVFSNQLGYVPQDDIVHRELTVERALFYAARLRLPSDMTEEQLQQRIDDVLEDVDMRERRHLRISKLSGGQRKRVSMALELLAQPGILFLDEPTSGLDPGLDYRVMHLLRKLADKGQTLVLATHATSNIRLCDYVCFLAPGGRLAYFGPPDEALAYFGTDNFAKIYSLLEASAEHPHAPEEAQARFKSSPAYQKYITAPLSAHEKRETPATRPAVSSKKRRGNGWKHFALLFVRYLELIKNDTGNLLIVLLQAPLIALLLMFLIKHVIGSETFRVLNISPCPTTQAVLTTTGFPDLPNPTNPVVSTDCNRVMYFLQHNPRGQVYAAKHGGASAALQNFIPLNAGAVAQRMLFIMTFTAILFGCVNAIREIVKEAAIYRRERAVGLGILPYMFSKIVVLALLCLLQSAILVFVINVANPFQQGIIFPPVVEVYITITLTALSSMTMSLAISAIAPSADRALSLIPVLLMPQIVFSGTVFPFKDRFTQILAMLFAARWSSSALGTTSGLHSDRLGGDGIFGDTEIFNGTLFSTHTHAQAAQYLVTMWLALGMMVVVFICLTGIFLKLKDRRDKRA